MASMSPSFMAHTTLHGLVDVANGIVADKSANADQTYEIGLRIANYLTGVTCSDVKLTRVEGVVSIQAALEKSGEERWNTTMSYYLPGVQV